MADDFARQLLDALYNPETQPPQQPSRPLREKLAGVGETALTLGTGLAASVPAGLAGLASLIPTRGRAPSVNRAAQKVEDVQSALTYLPRIEAGQEYLGKTAGALGMLGAPAEYLGEKTLQYTGSPAAATGVNVLLDPVNFIGMPGSGKAAMATARGMGRAAAAAPRVAGEMAQDLIMGKGRMEGQRGAIKMKGGNWLAGEVEGATEPLRSHGPKEADRQWLLEHAEELRKRGQDPTPAFVGIERIPQTEALNNWIDKKLNRYIKNEMATPEDPVRKLAEQGILHFEPGADAFLRSEAKDRRAGSGQSFSQLGTSQLARAWEDISDLSIIPNTASDYQMSSSGSIPAGAIGIRRLNPWLDKVPPETKVYETASMGVDNLGFNHLIDELKNALDPNSDLPARLRYKPEDLEKVTMEQAVRRVHDINEYRAAKKAEANEVLARNPATFTFKEYPTVPGSDAPNTKGLAWKEIKAPDFNASPIEQRKEMIERLRAEAAEKGISPEDYIERYPRKVLEDALKYEGDVMGHCVGGYCDDVLSGRTKIYSLRDNKGEPLVTIEVKPKTRSLTNRTDWFTSQPEDVQNKITTEALALEKSLGTALEFGSRENWQKAFASVIDKNMGEELPAIEQIKGSGKKDRSQRLRIKETGYKDEPDAYLLPFIQDFVRSGNWSLVNDIQNTGLITPDRVLSSETRRRLEAQGVQIPKYMTEQEAKELSKQAIRASDIPTLDQSAGGMKRGGSVHISDNPDTMALELATGGAVKAAAKAAEKAAKAAKTVYPQAEGKSVLESLPRAPKAEPERVELTGALRPTEAPVRGQTSRELQKAQRQTLTDEQKELFERLKQSSPEFASAAKFMTPQEVSKIIANPAGVRQLETLLQVLPSAKELSSVAKAGAPKQGWYRASTQAIMDVFGPEDAPRFASLLAALSPQTSVEMNLLNTLNVWKNWTAAGRPDDPAAIKRIMGASVAGTKGEQSVLDAWVNNATRALSAQDPTKVTLSGPKVDSFYRNLADDVYRVTNDAWMASGLGVAQDLFSGSPTAIQIARGDPGLSPGYIGTSARMREAGQMANMLPAEAQETTWSLFMPLYETARSLGISPREVLQRGLLTPEVIRGTPDFATLLTQGKYGDILRGAGYEEQLSKLRPTPFTRTAPDLTLSEQRDLERAARRLEDLRELRGMESRSRTISLPKEGERPETAFAYGTYEAIPGRGLGHLESLIDEPLGTRQHFSSRVSGAFRDPQGRDVLQSALGLNPIATRPMTGAYRPEFEIPFQGTLREPTTGRPPMEINPGFATGVEVPVTKGMDIPDRLKRELTAVEAARGYMTAQRGSPWNAQIPTREGSSLFIPLEKKADPERMGLTSALTGGEFGLADTGAGTAVLNFGGPMSAAERAQLEAYLGGQGVATKNVSDYVDLSKAFEAGEGSGAATRQLLDIMATLPQSKREALSEAMRRPAGELADLYEKAAQTRDDKVREDLIRGLRIIQRAGLTGLGAALAAGEALAEEKPSGALPVSP